MLEISLGVSVFTIIILFLVGLILFARSKLVVTGAIDVLINDEKTFHLPVGQKLLSALAQTNLFLASACGGKGTCGQCRVRITEGGGDILPTETSLISKRESKQGDRLACQVPLKQNMKIEIPADVFGIKKWSCTVRSNRNVSSFIKELTLALPEGEKLNFRAGGYVQIECPPHHLYYKDIEVADEYRADWDKFDLWRYESLTKVAVERAYSMANYPSENDIIMLDVRIASPPPNQPDVPPGVMSSYIHSLRPGDSVTISGPFGEFFAKDTDSEMIYIAGGAGMAPMRSHIFDQLKRLHSKRKISFWYGARSKREIIYQHDFDQLQKEHDNFQWHVVLSQPRPDDDWHGYTGYVHTVLLREYLNEHPAPEDCEYYLCGPPMLTAAVVSMLDDLGVDPEDILFDDFG
ncbi:MAG: NADH:ubiquinone reductase (Na(+)-transporting) subunit F [Gammaproteobacteria bacterium]|nr:NADH:ubiquinone reductase (Na(+)-transporting) subunit F [Gammaproteobacteria bacterium]